MNPNKYFYIYKEKEKEKKYVTQQIQCYEHKHCRSNKAHYLTNSTLDNQNHFYIGHIKKSIVVSTGKYAEATEMQAPYQGHIRVCFFSTLPLLCTSTCLGYITFIRFIKNLIKFFIIPEEKTSLST